MSTTRSIGPGTRCALLLIHYSGRSGHGCQQCPASRRRGMLLDTAAILDSSQRSRSHQGCICHQALRRLRSSRGISSRFRAEQRKVEWISTWILHTPGTVQHHTDPADARKQYRRKPLDNHFADHPVRPSRLNTRVWPICGPSPPSDNSHALWIVRCTTPERIVLEAPKQIRRQY